ncbi:MAG: adventurous gliding motility protein CglF [Deltaproteobacteria bacterium]|nr:adventurous gliding motility protein CglF [Deltaproteobacteria bacterium]
MKVSVATITLATLLATASAAQDDGVNVEGGVSYQRKTVINFEDDTIEGDLKTPDGQYLNVKKKLRHKSLIRIRKDFRREVLSSVGDL